MKIYAKNLTPEVRYWGYELDYYDEPIHCFGLWWFHLYWGVGFKQISFISAAKDDN